MRNQYCLQFRLAWKILDFYDKNEIGIDVGAVKVVATTSKLH